MNQQVLPHLMPLTPVFPAGSSHAAGYFHLLPADTDVQDGTAAATDTGGLSEVGCPRACLPAGNGVAQLYEQVNQATNIDHAHSLSH